jgi:hypothetical protein
MSNLCGVRKSDAREEALPPDLFMLSQFDSAQARELPLT